MRLGNLNCCIAEYGRNEPRPAPPIHVDDRIGVAEHVLLLGEPRIENAGMALCAAHDAHIYP